MKLLKLINQSTNKQNITRLQQFKFSENQPQKQQDQNPKQSIYELNTAQDYILQNIKKHDWPSYIIGNYYPKQIRNDFYSLNWLNIELMRIPEGTKDSSLAQGKLEFWLDSIEQIYKNKPVKEPISICLHNTCQKNLISKQLFTKLVNTRKQEASTQTIGDMSQLENLAENIRTTMILMNLSLLRINYQNDENLLKAASHVGRCIGILDYIKRIPYSLRKYRLYMPQDILTKHNVSIRNLWERIEGKPKDELFDVVLEVAAYAKKHLELAKELQKDLPPQAFRAFLHAAESEYYLEQLEKNNFDVFSRNMNTNSYLVLPTRVFRAAKNKKFTLY